MTAGELRERGNALAYRVASLGIGPDIAGLSFVELWAVYAFLRRIAEGD